MTLSDILGDFSTLQASLQMLGYSPEQINKSFQNIEKSNDTVNRYSQHKRLSEKIAQTYLKTNLHNKQQLSDEIKRCGKTLVMAREKETGKMQVIEAYFCKKRMCSLCAFRRSLKNYSNIKTIISQPEYKNLQWIFITLTIKSCSAEDLESTIHRLLNAFAKMTSNKTTSFRKAFLGWFRALEVTYNEETKEYHPHLHILACVNDNYFRKDNKNYYSEEKLCNQWQKFLNKAEYEIKENRIIRGGHKNQLIASYTKKTKKKYEPIDYVPICHIEAVRETQEKQIAEVAKYTVKPVDYSDKPEVLETLTRVLERKRCSALGGLMKETSQRLKLEDAEDENGLLDCNETFREKILKDPKFSLYLLSWNIGAKSYDIEAMNRQDGSPTFFVERKI